MDYETEEQQLEAIKKWWKDNSSMIVTGVSVGVASIFGWQFYQQNTIQHTEQASIIYEYVVSSTKSNENIIEQQTRVNQLTAEYSDTPYASLTSLLLAKQYLTAGEPEKAIQQLQWVTENAGQDELEYLAKIRLARVYFSLAQTAEALKIVNQEFPESFKAIVLELKGDLLVSQGEMDNAKSVYLEAQGYSSASRWLQVKIDDLGGTNELPAETILDQNKA